MANPPGAVASGTFSNFPPGLIAQSSSDASLPGLYRNWQCFVGSRQYSPPSKGTVIVTGALNVVPGGPYCTTNVLVSKEAAGGWD